jgi:uncharacterized protein YrrD
MDVPINAKVECQEHDCGKTTCVIVNPIKKVITHFVVQEKGILGIERLIPVDKILKAREDHVTLSCSLDEFRNFEPFRTGHYVSSEERFLEYDSDNYYLHPFLTAEMEGSFTDESGIEETVLIPVGELGIHRGSIVHALDGKVGQVDEFIIVPDDDNISHLVLREGHLWGQKLVTIPVGEIDQIDTDDVHLKLRKKDIEKLPVIPVKRHYP